MTQPRSLKARALQWLAQREQSRVELRRKLLPYALAQDVAAAAAGLPKPKPEPASSARVEAVLDWLEAERYLSPTRFAESRTRVRGPRFGNLKICRELKQHALTLSPEALQVLKDSEPKRARLVRERKFVDWPADAVQRARQVRFLESRGFTLDVILRVMRLGANHNDDG